ncbi:MAG: 3,4-dihydroxy-2-butanone-4-phosphate synthase [Thermoplasmatales archaeon]|nr:3,4-dihydroxy-2-butanone-4-phosphate synthase [Thermoplasmatales archaeon]
MIEEALNSLKKGKFVLVYDADGREEETDFVVASEFVNPEKIKSMRKNGGGLICATVYHPVAKKLGLPFLVEIFDRSSSFYGVLKVLKADDIPYDSKSSFSLTINHRRTFTGITDVDRALTISEFAKMIKNYGDRDDGVIIHEFGKNFRSPGHVALLCTSKELLKSRRGHTELSTALLLMAGLTPSAAICEMIGDDGRALSKNEAKKYAEKNGLVFLEGKEILGAWSSWSG